MTAVHREFLKSLTLSDLLNKSRDVVTIDPDTTVEKALFILADENILSLPIVDSKKGDGKVLGILNVTDLATVIAFQDTFKQFKDAPAKLEWVDENTFDKLLNTKILSTKAIDVVGLSSESKTIWEYTETEPLDTILEIFAKGVHRVIVHTKDKKLRYLSQSDVVIFLKKNLDKLGEIVTTPLDKAGLEGKVSDLITVSMYQTALIGFQKLYNHGWELSGIPVVDKTGDLVATLSASDLRGLNKGSFKYLLLPVLDFLRLQKGGIRPAITTQSHAEIGEIIRKFVYGHVHRIWIVKNHKITGVVSLSDILAKLSPVDYRGI